MSKITIPVMYLHVTENVIMFVPKIGRVNLKATDFESAELEASELMPELLREYESEHGLFPEASDADLPIVKQISVKVP